MTQSEALDILKLGHNVYLTGSAGSGKTHTLNQYIKYLKDNKIEVAVTASTGIAATHMNGITIHSWSGLGIRDSISLEELEELEERKYLWDRISKTKVLIIDEVSMLHHFRLDLIDQVVRAFKRINKPFGGIQVVLCGDFFQLPPVSRMGERPAFFIYKSDSWKLLNPKICYLHEQHRQTDDVHLEILNSIRRNDITEEVYAHLQSRHNKDPEIDIEPTRLYTHNIDVDTINSGALESIDAEERLYSMTHKGRPALVETIKKTCLAPERLWLKIGARVMFVKNNFDAGYVNGTLGKVISFDEDGPVVETSKGTKITAHPQNWSIEEDGKIKAEITQVPLRLAWAITVHKSQGMSLDAVEVDLSKSFERGMGYVALSRVRTLAGLKLLGINNMALQVNEEVFEYDMELQKLSKEAEEELQDIKPEDKKSLQEEFVNRNAAKQKTEEIKLSTYEETKKLVLAKAGIQEMAKQRGVTIGTIISHLEHLVVNEMVTRDQVEYLKPKPARFRTMQQAFNHIKSETGEMKLSPVRDLVGNSYNFEELRIARLFIS